MADENTSDSSDAPNESGSANEPGGADHVSSSSVDASSVDAVAPAEASTALGAASVSTPAALTPGQRLAAKKALKATHKREFKEELKRKEDETRREEQEQADRLLGRARVEGALPQNVERAAGTFTHFLQDNRERILLAVGAALAIAGLAIGLQRFLHSGSAEQAAELGRALEITNARIDADDTDGTSDDGKPVFKSETDRATKAIAAYGDAVKTDSESLTATWSKLGQAAAQIALGKHAEAHTLFQGALAGGRKQPEIAARALEGVGVALEAQGKADAALKAYEQLKATAGQKELGEYHIARLRLAKGDRDGAKGLLKALYDQLNAAKEDSPPSQYLRSEVELRLAELDSTLVDQGSAQQPQQFSDEQLQRLIQQLQQRQGKGEPGAAGE